MEDISPFRELKQIRFWTIDSDKKSANCSINKKSMILLKTTSKSSRESLWVAILHLKTSICVTLNKDLNLLNGPLT